MLTAIRLRVNLVLLLATVFGVALGVTTFLALGSRWSFTISVGWLPVAPMFLLGGAVVGLLWSTAILALWSAWWAEMPPARTEQDEAAKLERTAAGQNAKKRPPLSAEDRRARLLLLVSLTTLLTALIAYARFGAMLYSLHDAGEPRFTIDEITSPLISPENRAARVLDAVSVWSTYGAAPPVVRQRGAPQIKPPVPTPNLSRDLPVWAFATDALVLVPSLVIVLTLSVSALRRQIAREQLSIDPTAGEVALRYVRWGRYVLFVLAAYAIADTVENVSAWISIDAFWGGLVGEHGPDACLSTSGLSNDAGCRSRWIAFFWLFTIAVVAKWVTLALVAGYLASAAGLLLHHSLSDTQRWIPLQRLGRVVASLSLPLLVVAVFGTVLFAPIANEQFADLIRRWIDEPRVAWWGIGLTVALAAAVWWCTWWQLLELRPVAGSLPRPAWLGVAAITFYAVLWTALWQISNGQTPALWVACLTAVTLVLGISLALGGRSLIRLGDGWVLPVVVSLPAVVVLGVAVFASAGCLPGIFPLPLDQTPCNRTLALRPLTPVLLFIGVVLLGLPFSGWPNGRGTDAEIRRLVRERSNSLPFYLASAILTLLAVTMLSTGLDVLIFRTWEDIRPWAEKGTGQSVTLLVMSSGVLLLAFLVAVVGSLRLADGPARWAHFRLVLKKNRSVRWQIGTPVALLTVCVTIWAALIGYVAQDPNNLHWLMPAFGGVGLLSLALILITVLGTSCFSLVNMIMPTQPALFRFLGYRRVPLLTLLSVWMVAVSVLPPQDVTHDVRILPPTQDPSATANLRVKLPDAFEDWLEQQCISGGAGTPAVTSSSVPSSTASGKPVVPLILVASSGGGIRAAVWTTYVMDRVFKYGESSWAPADGSCALGRRGARRASSWIFAASGISGGSVGLATYAARQSAYDKRASDARAAPGTARLLRLPEPDQEGASRNPDEGWISKTLGQDGVSSTLGWMLFVETPWSVFRYPLARDRAATLEETWERWWEQSLTDTSGRRVENTRPAGREGVSESAVPPTLPTFLAMRGTSRDLPLMIFSGASVESGCRFNASALSADGRDQGETSTRCLAPLNLTRPATLGATVDLISFLCKHQDISLSTAAFLSARFPVISPSGRLEECLDGNDPGEPVAAEQDPLKSAPVRPQTFVVDGGYHESSGAGTALDLWLALEPLVEAYNLDPARPAAIVPFMIQIDNGYSEPASPGVVAGSPQFAVPLVTIAASVAANHERARQTARLTFARSYQVAPGVHYCDARYALFTVRAHPGAAAPLGWTLSSISIDDLLAQYQANVADNEVSDLVRGWISLPADGSGQLAATCPKGA